MTKPHFLLTATLLTMTGFAQEDPLPNPDETSDPVDVAEDLADGVRIEFMGRSGGMKFYTDAERYISVHQQKLEERDANGEKCRGGGQDRCTSINVAGNSNSWSDVSEVDDMLSTEFTVEKDGVTLRLLAHASKSQEKSEFVDPVPAACTGCTNTDNKEGFTCQHVGNGQCQAANEDGACPNEASQWQECTQSGELEKNKLEFSLVVNGFTFKSADNTLSYGLKIQSSGGDAGIQDGGKVSVGDDGIVSWPTTATVNNNGTSTEVDVMVAVSVETDASADLGTYPGYTPGSEVRGTVDVTANEHEVTIAGTITGLNPYDGDVYKSGFHIHAGDSCADGAPGAHWFNEDELCDEEVLAETGSTCQGSQYDPWNTGYTLVDPDCTSNCAADIDITISAEDLGYNPLGAIGRVVVAHDANGKVACGVIDDASSTTFVNFLFDSFAAGSQLYFDPTLEAAAIDSSNAHSSNAQNVAISGSGILLAGSLYALI